jgi:Na+/proline symporter/signal transduction histidine kinase
VTLSAALIAGVTLAYLAMLLAAAHAGDTWPRAARLSRHPFVVALSLGVYATSWSYFGSVGMAAREGYRFLTIYLGVTLACAAAPLLWEPVARVLRERQLATLPDLFAFRYRSQALGVLATLFLLAGSLPYQALQLRGLVTAVEVLGGTQATALVGVTTCACLVLFGAVYGARNLAPRERHDGLVLAVAIESFVKLVALLAIGGFALFGVLGSNGSVEAAAAALHRPELARTASEGPWASLLLLAFSAAFLLPRQWHLAFTEGAGTRAFRTIAWALPLYLLLLTISVPLVLAAGTRIDPFGEPDFYVLTLARASGSPALGALAFLGGLSASTAMILVTAVALASMALTHLVLPVTGPLGGNLYRRLRWVRRALIAVIVTGGYLVYVLLPQDLGLADLGLVSFVAVAQFLPGLVGVLFWSRATARGVFAGLLVGVAGWLATLAVPLLVAAGALPAGANLFQSLVTSSDPWTLPTALSLGGNTLVFAVVSLLSQPRPDEVEAAAACRREAHSPVGLVTATSAEEFVLRLSPALGASTAAAEVENARRDLGLDPHERRPAELGRLRDRIEQNLSGLLGPVLSRAVVDEGLSLDPTLRSAVAARLYLGDDQPGRPSVPALDAARRYLRRIVEDLPEGVCTIDPHGEVVLWNAALGRITGVSGDRASGMSLSALPEPWRSLLLGLSAGAKARREARVSVNGVTRDLALVKSTIDPAALPGAIDSGGLVLLVEDRTEQYALQARVAHQDRLASIGRLAAGVAHEIGNPLTGIASVAQNLQHDIPDPDAVERLELIVQQTRRIDRIVRTLVGFAHAGATGGRSDETLPAQAPVPLAAVVQEAFTLTRLGLGSRAIELEARVPVDLLVLADRQRLSQVFVNLCTNACDASPDGGRVEVTARAAEAHVLIEVVDHGSGMLPSVRARALEPFFTTKMAGEGTGLGLSLVYSILTDLGGSLDLQSEVGVGTTVTIRLPSPAAVVHA